MLLRYVMTFAIVALTSCGGSLSLPNGKKTIAQLAFILPDRTELSGEVKDIKTQMNAYRLAITPDDDYETDAENCSTHEELEPYEDGKEVLTEIKAGCAYNVEIGFGKYLRKRETDEASEEDSSDSQNLRLTDEVENVDPLDKIYFEGTFILQKVEK